MIVIVAAMNNTYVNFPKKFTINKLAKVINNKKREEYIDKFEIVNFCL